MNNNQLIVTNPAICHGKPVFKGTRIMVWQILEMLSHGDGLRDIKIAFPQIINKHLKASLEYASQLAREDALVNAKPPQIPALPA